MFRGGLDLLRIQAMAVGLLVAVDIHEWAHAWAANELGDSTARDQGRLSFNPLVHLDPLGTLMMLFSLLGGLGIGWGKPVPVNPWRLRRGRVDMGLVALAGPASNLILAALLAVPLRLGWVPSPWLQLGWLMVISVNVSLALFNLLPFPPLDGADVLLGLLSVTSPEWAYHWSDTVARMGAQAPLLFFMVVLADQALGGRILGLLLGVPHGLILRLMLGG